MEVFLTVEERFDLVVQARREAPPEPALVLPGWGERRQIVVLVPIKGGASPVERADECAYRTKANRAQAGPGGGQECRSHRHIPYLSLIGSQQCGPASSRPEIQVAEQDEPEEAVESAGQHITRPVLAFQDARHGHEKNESNEQDT